ncbi:MAG: hypothetical protein ACJ8AO_09920 [Gemmatimonadaceae bacterium]
MSLIHRRAPVHRASVPLVLSAVALAACGGEPRTPGAAAAAARARAAAAAPKCAPASDGALAPAVLAYIKLASPTPQRFLVASGTDSALPEAGLRALQSKGPTYFYPADERLRAQVKKRMADIGEYASLLVTMKEARAVGDTEAIVRLRGWYVGGKHDGRSSPLRTVHLACDTTGWQVRRTTEDQSA